MSGRFWFQGNFSGSAFSGSHSGSFQGSGADLTGITTAWDNVTSKPAGLVSGSEQVNSGSFSGSFQGDGSSLTGVGGTTTEGEWNNSNIRIITDQSIVNSTTLTSVATCSLASSTAYDVEGILILECSDLINTGMKLRLDGQFAGTIWDMGAMAMFDNSWAGSPQRFWHDYQDNNITYGLDLEVMNGTNPDGNIIIFLMGKVVTGGSGPYTIEAQIAQYTLSATGDVSLMEGSYVNFSKRL